MYLFSREAGVSYAAAAWQLTQHHKLTRPDAETLIRLGAAAAKTELRGMPGVSDARADVWILGPGSDGISIACRLGDELHLRLPEDLSVGRTWAVDRPVIGTLDAPPQPRLDLLWDGNQDFSSANNQTARPVGSNAAEGMDLVYDAHLGADATATAQQPGTTEDTDEASLLALATGEVDSLAGQETVPELPGPGRRAITLVARDTGVFEVMLSLRPAWDRSAEAAATISFTVSVSARKILPAIGFAEPQRDLYAAGVAAA